jgi:hypothetical protein
VYIVISCEQFYFIKLRVHLVNEVTEELWFLRVFIGSRYVVKLSNISRASWFGYGIFSTYDAELGR